MIKGLGTNKKPFLYLDDFCPTVDWERFHDEVSIGLAKSVWQKRYVSVGVHNDWQDQEIATYIRTLNITEHQLELYKKYIDDSDTEAKLKYFMAITPAPHPFWSCFIRLNKVLERSRLVNKAVAEDCIWTENRKYFPTLIKLIEKLPFKEVGRVMIFITEANNSTVPHFDAAHVNKDKKNDDFIWFVTNPNYKKIFVMDGDTKEKIYPDPTKKFLWFNEMDYHGTDPCERFSFSIRIDGVFNDDVKKALSF